MDGDRPAVASMHSPSRCMKWHSTSCDFDLPTSSDMFMTVDVMMRKDMVLIYIYLYLYVYVYIYIYVCVCVCVCVCVVCVCVILCVWS